MKILLISGSKNRKGRTARAMEAIVTGAEKVGAETETCFLTELNMEHCRQCEDDGWGICRREGWCVIKDDFADLVGKIQESDLVVFASPVYFQDLTESMKAFLDRLRRISAFNENSPTAGTTAVGICLAGGGGGFAPRTCFILDSTLQMCRFDVVDMIPLRRQNFEIKLPMLEYTGGWLATNPKSSDT